MKNADSKKMVTKIGFISFFLLLIFYILSRYFSLPYSLLSISKIILFAFGGVLFYYLLQKKGAQHFVTLKKGSKLVGASMLIGIIIMLVVWAVYFVLRGKIDLENITQLLSNQKVDKSSFPYVALYITIGNSFLEEFFFRGFLFLQLYDLNYKKTAYLLSGLFFSAYHIAIFESWFSFEIMLLALAGLFAGNMIFCYFDIKSKSILNSWIMHACIDFSIMVIGFIMFSGI